MATVTNILIDDLRHNKRTAQERLLSLYGEMVFRQIARIVTRQEDAEEIYQDVFVKVFRKIDTYDENQATLATWLSRIAHNETLNFVRKKKPGIVYLEDSHEDLENIEDTSALQHNKQTTLLLEQALEQLPPYEKSIISMFYYDNIELKEIAYITDSIPTTIGSQLCRIRRKLYRIIKTLQP
ncbi:MAG: sigma-70 family RNA polymerase sigma factor [Prevotella sp.]|nr:sigma-70 family RNA polymerase sigma factor [Prevotella sp.]